MPISVWVAPPGSCSAYSAKHRQDDEHAEQPQPVDAGEAGGGAPLGGGHPDLVERGRSVEVGRNGMNKWRYVN
jgi:hypothetical protein